MRQCLYAGVQSEGNLGPSLVDVRLGVGWTGADLGITKMKVRQFSPAANALQFVLLAER